MSERPYLTIREAAAACDTSPATIRRRRDAGAFPDARKTAGGAWEIPVDNLLAAGLRVNAPAPAPAQVSKPSEQPASGAVSEGELAQVACLLEQLAEERTARRLAEEQARHLREVVDMQHKSLDDFRLALRALTAGVSNPELAHVPAQSEGPDLAHERPVSYPMSEGELAPEQPSRRPRRRWFGRR